LLKFYCACALAAVGDTSDVAAEALVSFISAPAFEDGYTLVRFPWVKDVSAVFHREASMTSLRDISTQIAVIEAFGAVRGNARAAEALNGILGSLKDTDWRLMAIYAAGANGHVSLRRQLEYLRDCQANATEAEAARIALEHFGTGTFLEIGMLHGKLNPKGELVQQKSGCFIATAVYGSADCPEVAMLRQFRDTVLLSTGFGRLGVKAYYRISPAIAHVVSTSGGLKVFVKTVILQPVLWCVWRLVRRQRVGDSMAQARG
jgi:hypothetical protein